MGTFIIKISMGNLLIAVALSTFVNIFLPFAALPPVLEIAYSTCHCSVVFIITGSCARFACTTTWAR